MKTVVFTRQAAKDLDALAAEDRDFVVDGLSDYAVTGQGDVKRLRGSEIRRLRIGRFRVLFDEDGMRILAIYVGKRETTTYRNL